MVEKGKILIVDDSPSAIGSILAELDKHSLAASIALSGSEALKKIGDEIIDLIFLDIHMPETNGLDFLQKLNKEKIDIPCVIVSQESDPVFFERAKKFGAKGWIPKPITANTILLIYEKFVVARSQDTLF